MTVGEKIRTIRTFRGMTQKELGLAVGFPEKGADNRIRHSTKQTIAYHEKRCWTKLRLR